MRVVLKFGEWRCLTKKSRRHLRAAALKFCLTGLLLQSFGHVSGTDAARTCLNGQDAAVFYRSDFLQVGIPDRAGFIIGVAYIVSEAGAFSTNITFS